MKERKEKGEEKRRRRGGEEKRRRREVREIIKIDARPRTCDLAPGRSLRLIGFSTSFSSHWLTEGTDAMK